MRSFLLHLLAVFSPAKIRIVLTLILFLILPTSTFGASLSFLPASGSYQAGTSFSISINVNSEEQSINAVSGVVSFSPDQLEIVSLSKNQSIISLWVQEPYFSNSAGTINFEGIVLNPGFTGQSGKILNVTLRAKSEGEPVIKFTSGSILANDGEGSEILTGKKSAQFSITGSTVASPEPQQEEITPSVAETSVVNLIPKVVSETHPLDGWSKETNGLFNFILPTDVTAMRLLLDEQSYTTPVVVYAPPIARREIEQLPEGVSYLHVQYKNGEGWGEILHYKVQIDTKAPDSFSLTQVIPGFFLFDAKDSLSGIARYEVQIDGGAVMEYIDDGSHVYRAPEQVSGSHIIYTRAYDVAGNFIAKTLPFEIPPVSVNSLVNPEGKGVQPADSMLIPQGALLITILSVVIPSVALILLLCFMLYGAWRFAGGLQKRIKKEVEEASLIVHKAFAILRLDLEADIETLKRANKKRKLTHVESKILKRLQKNLSEAELVINKEISDIDKEVG